MITLKPRKKKTICNHLLQGCQIVKLTHIVYKNISYGNLVFTEQLLKIVESFRNKLSKTELVSKQNACETSLKPLIGFLDRKYGNFVY